MNDKYLGEYITNKLNGHGRYQIYLSLALFFIGIFSSFTFIYLPLMQTMPYITYPGIKEPTKLTYELCKRNDIEIDYKLSKPTFLLNYDKRLYCDRWYIIMLNLSNNLGSALGSFIIRFFIKIGSRKAIFILGMIISLVTSLLYIKNMIVYCVVMFIFGLANMAVSLFRNIIVTDITDAEYRSYFLNTQLLPNIIAACFYFFLFTENITWEWVYGSNAVAYILISIIYIFFFIETPRYYLLNSEVDKDKEGLVNCIRYIGKINKCKEIEEIVDTITCKSNEMTTSLNDSVEDVSRSFVAINNKEDSEIDGMNNFLISSEKQVKRKEIRKFKWYFYRTTLFIFTFCFMNLNWAINYESKYHSDRMGTYFYYTNAAILIAFFIASFLMNVRVIGRRYTIILFMLLLLAAKIFKQFYQDDKQIDMFCYLIVRFSYFSITVPGIALKTESLTTKERQTTYGVMIFVGKLANIGLTFVVEHASSLFFDIFIIVATGLMIISVFILKETLGKSLKDN